MPNGKVRLRHGSGYRETRRPGTTVPWRPSSTRTVAASDPRPRQLDDATLGRLDRLTDVYPAATGHTVATRLCGTAVVTTFAPARMPGAGASPPPPETWVPEEELRQKAAFATARKSAAANDREQAWWDGEDCPFDLRCLCPGRPH